MTTIFIDESGYTGEDLFNRQQPVFVIASHNIDEQKCKEIKKLFFHKVQARELKHSVMCKYPKQQNMIIRFLEYLVDNKISVKLSIVNKQYTLVCKMVEMIEVVMNDDGIDIYDRGGNLGLANMLYYCLPVFGGRDFFSDLLVKFQNLLRERDEASFDLFFEPLFNRFESEDLEDLLTFFRIIPVRYGYRFLDYITKNSLDISFTCALTLMANWRKEIKHEIHLVHDASTNMAKQKNIWDALMDPTLPNIVTGYNTRTLEFPVAVSTTLFENSTNWAGLQLADIIAGATAHSLEWVINGKSPKDMYAHRVSELVNEFVKHAIWPHEAVTPRELDAEGSNFANPIDFITSVIKS